MWVLDFPWADSDVTAVAMGAFFSGSDPDAANETSAFHTIAGNPFFKFWSTDRVGQRTIGDFTGEAVGDLGGFFAPERIAVLQQAWERGIRSLVDQPESVITHKLNRILAIKGIANLDWSPISRRLGSRWLDHAVAHQAALTAAEFPPQATVIMTYECNRDCAYCFSADLAHREPGMLSDAMFGRIQGWLANQQVSQVCLFGGEPTQHPELPRMAEALMDSGYGVYFATNGFFSESVAEALSHLPLLKLTVHIPTVSTGPPAGWDRLKRNLASIHPDTALNYRVNLADGHGDLQWLAEALAKRPPEAMSAAIAFPSEAASNTYVPYSDIARHAAGLVAIGRLGARYRVPTALVKPTPLCRFSMPDLLGMLQHFGIRNRCDIREGGYTRLTTISPQGWFYPCMALPHCRTHHLDANPTLNQLGRTHRQLIDHMDTHPAMAECADCRLGRSELCQGLCFSYSVGACCYGLGGGNA